MGILYGEQATEGLGKLSRMSQIELQMTEIATSLLPVEFRL